MDSRLLNAYHDDPYECYESNITDVWTTHNIEMELEHTLDGILPIRATEVENETYCNIFYPEEHIFGDKENNSHALVYNDFAEQQLSAEERVGTIETTKLHSNVKEVDVFDAVNLIEDDGRSQYSNTSFRTRTDSSSIADYESHSSDYDDSECDYDDDDDDDEDDNEVDELRFIDKQEDGDDEVFGNVAIEALEADDLLTDLPGLNLLSEQFLFMENGAKQRTLSSTTIGSDVDAANFDLAEFITKDDDLLTKVTVSTSAKRVPAATDIVQPQIKQSTVTKITKLELENDGDSDSDVIVDVETVEFEDNKKHVLLLKHNAAAEMPDDSIAFVDNVKADPEWNPKEVKLKSNKSMALSPAAKKICESTTKGGKLKKLKTSTQNNTKTAIINKKQILKCTQTNMKNTAVHRHGIGKGGKNLALLKRDCESIEATATCAEAKTKGKDIALIKHDCHSIEVNKQNKNNKNSSTKNSNNNNINNSNNNNDNSVITKPNVVETEKRRLNLDEYKRRFAGEDLNNANKPKGNQMKPKTTTTTTQTPIKTTQTIPIAVKPINLSPNKINKPHSEAVTSIVKTLKEQQHNQEVNQKIDPITLARNKVLRMQELKRAQQMKIIDSTISAKVPRVTKLLPLQEIIKDTAYAIKPEKDEKTNGNVAAYANHPDYERIVMVSAACNTALTLSPHDVLPNVPLLKDISRATADQVKISHNSLITSIQDAVVKQSLPKIATPVANMNEASTSTEQQLQQQQHGEDKIIMHLRKDRIREHNTRSIEIQTDFQAAFPTLQLPKYLRNMRHTRRKYRKHDATSNSMSASSGMESSDDENLETSKRHGGSGTSSAEYPNSEINGGGTGSIGGYSSRSSRRHRSSVSSSYSESGHQRCSRDPKRKSNYRKSMHQKSRSSSSSSESSLSDYSDRSRSRGRRSRSRSRSPFYANSNTRRESNFGDRNVSKPAVEERRIVYVGRIEEETSKEMLRRKFIAYGSIRQITVHYKENGMKYGFVTFERSEDAFAVIDSSARDNQINMYDISFGGRRAFCRTSYADLDNAGINNYQSYVFPKAPAPPKQEDSFEALLKKMKAKLDASKSTPAASSSTTDVKP